MSKRFQSVVAVAALTAWVSLSCLSAAAQNAADLLQPVLSKVEHKIAVSVKDVPSGAALFEHNAHDLLKPASTLKILTTIVALRDLGPDFTFDTQLLGDEIGEGVLDCLYVKGSGDPELGTQSTLLMARKLKRLGIKQVQKICLDATLFEDTFARVGERAFETGSSALSFNYNSVLFEVCPTKPGWGAKITVEPWESDLQINGKVITSKGGVGGFSIDEKPAAPSAARIGYYEAAGVIRADAKCSEIYRSTADPARILGLVFKDQLQQLGISVLDSSERRAAPAGAKLLYTHKSKPLSQLVEDLNHYSNNFMAEQLLAALGADQGLAPAGRTQGILRLATYLQQVGFSEEEFSIFDGSGLSHNDRLSVHILATLLVLVQKDLLVRAPFENSLVVPGQQGTLKKRKFDPPQMRLRAKTGTLDGAHSLAGYLVSKKGSLLAFAIVQNGSRNKKYSELVESQVLSILYSQL